MAHFWVRRGPEMIVCHRPLTSLNMSPYRTIWIHFRPIFMISIDLILQTGKAAGIWASCLDPRQFFNDFLKTKKMCNVRTIILAAVSSHIEPYGPISNQFWCQQTFPDFQTQGSNTSQGPLLRPRGYLGGVLPWRKKLVFWSIFDFYGPSWGQGGLEMIVSHRPLTSLNMSPYRAIWTHFRQIFIDLILQTGKSCWHLR